MGFEIKLHPDAVKFLLNLDPDTKESIKTGIKSLETSTFRSQSRSGTRVALREHAVRFATLKRTNNYNLFFIFRPALPPNNRYTNEK